jgi:hypothetical protein
MKSLSNSNLTLVATTSGCLLMFACGSDSESADIGTARSGWSELSRKVDGDLHLYRESGGASTLEFACDNGGTVEVDGAVVVQALPVRIDVDATVSYAGCVTARDVQLDGDVHFSQKVAAGGGELVRVETIYSGNVDFGGAVEARCDVDVRALVDLDGQLVEVSGAFCGQPAARLDAELSPLWIGAAPTTR